MIRSNEAPEWHNQKYRLCPQKKDNKPHDWNKEQPHHVVTGEITTEKYAREHPDQVEWVKDKKPDKQP